MISKLSRCTTRIVRPQNLSKCSQRLSHEHSKWDLHVDQENIPGACLPFQISNPYKLAFAFIIYFGSGLAMPFLFVRHHLKRKYNT
ncbi:hypothetical protein GJ496_009114 [Pomphorhynchus laevis]|nr:hypothetical protein GJ496_009114 [Pomphorhynchus laevis]